MSTTPLRVERREHTVTEHTKWGDVEKGLGQDIVIVNGKHAGYVPTGKDDPHRDIFHPLSGFPQELCSAVVKSAGFKSSLPAPVPHELQDEDDE